MTLSTLFTDRLVLRASAPQDAPILASALNNYAISKWLTTVPYPYSLADAQWFIDANAAGRFCARLIWEGDKFVGVIGLDGELGYWLSQDAWGQGYATEAARAVVDDYFANTAAERIYASYFVDNKASCNVLTKTGFVDLDAGLHFSKARGETVPVRRMELTQQRHRILSSGTQ